MYVSIYYNVLWEEKGNVVCNNEGLCTLPMYYEYASILKLEILLSYLHFLLYFHRKYRL